MTDFIRSKAVITLNGANCLAVIVFGLLFGFGFAVGGAIWRAIAGK